MSESTLWTLAAFAALVALLTFSLVRTRAIAWQERQLLALANRAGLVVPSALEAELLRIVARRQRAWTWAWGSVYSVGLLVFVFGSGRSAGPFPFLLLPVSMLVAGAAAVTVVMIDPRRAALGNPVARLQTVRLTDLVPRRAVGLVSGAVALAVALAVTRTVVGDVAPIDGAAASEPWEALVLAGMAGALLLAWFVSSRAIARRRPLSGDAATLAWSDALRAESVRDLLVVPTLPALMAIPLLLADTARVVLTDPNAVSAASGIAVYATLALATALLIIMFDHRTTRHFHRALWPAPPAEPATIAS